MAGVAWGVTFTEELKENSEEYGVFWCPLFGDRTGGTDAIDKATDAEFNQKIEVMRTYKYALVFFFCLLF